MLSGLFYNFTKRVDASFSKNHNIVVQTSKGHWCLISKSEKKQRFWLKVLKKLGTLKKRFANPLNMHHNTPRGDQ